MIFIILIILDNIINKFIDYNKLLNLLLYIQVISIGEMEDDEERDIFYFIYFNT